MGLGLGFGFVKLAKICSTIDSLQCRKERKGEGEGGLAKQLMDSLRREVGSDFSYLFRMRVLIMPYYSPRQAQ